MNRFEFISSLIGLPLLNFCSNEKFGAEILIGKGKPNLVGKDHRLLPEVEKAYQNMERAARAAGIKVKMVSSYRSYEKQKAIWNRKFNAFKTLIALESLLLIPLSKSAILADIAILLLNSSKKTPFTSLLIPDHA